MIFVDINLKFSKSYKRQIFVLPVVKERPDKGSIRFYFSTYYQHNRRNSARNSVISKKFARQVKLEKVVIDEKGNISIGDRRIKMETLPKVMYIGFLKQIDGIVNNQLCDSKELFEEI